jgi:uncharacterized protein (DUF2062 family)
MSPRRLYQRLKKTLVQRILRVNDTPHRIALGVGLGFLIGWSPTLGAQVLIYLLVATIVRANRVSGILPILMTNPLTAVPLYYTSWVVGRLVLTGTLSGGEAEWAAISSAMIEAGKLQNILTPLFWQNLWEVGMSFGREMWVGCLVLGTFFGLIGYVSTYYAVSAWQRRRHERRAIRNRFRMSLKAPLLGPAAEANKM